MWGAANPRPCVVSTALYLNCLYVGFPCRTHLLNHFFRQGGVIQLVSLFAAGFVSPVEELQHFGALSRVFLLFVHGMKVVEVIGHTLSPFWSVRS